MESKYASIGDDYVFLITNKSMEAATDLRGDQGVT